MAVDFEEPHKDQEYITLLESIRDALALVSTLIDDREDTPDNIPTRAKRWNSTLDKFQEWTGAAWLDDVLSIAGGGTGAVTAAAARTALGLIGEGEVADLITAHNAVTSAHQALSTATANRILVRDSNGRAKVVAPSAESDIALKSTVTAHSDLTNPHSSTDAATASRLILRDASGRAKIANPSDNADIVNKGYMAAADAVVLATGAAALLATIALTGGRFVSNANGNPTISDTILDLTVMDSWRSIGATGTGATHIWTALNTPVTAAADWVEVSGYLYDTATGLSNNTNYSCELFFRQSGSSEAASLLTNVVCYVLGVSTGTGKWAFNGNFCRKVPVTGRKFEYRMEDALGGPLTPNARLFLTGWGYNP